MTNPDTSHEKRYRYLPWIILAVIAVIAIPLGLVAMGLTSVPGAGMDQCGYCDELTDYAPATRTGPDSIHIIMQPDTTRHHNRIPTVRIYVNDRDISNQSLIAASDLDVIISPPDGLVFESGSSVTLQGVAVAGNKSMPVHLQIIATYPDTGRRIVIGEQLF
jgi:hypothetical protein